MKNSKRLILIKKLWVTTISIAVYFVIINNFLLLSKDMIYGDFSGETIFPKPLFGFFRIPDYENTREHNAINRLAVDYAQIYFPSQEFSSLTQNYQTGYLDPLRRQSRYAPFIHYLCSISLCKLDYGYACFLHMLIQLLLFYYFFIFTFKILKIESDLGLGLLLANIFLFATPAGLGWFERGQFSLYVTLSYLLLIMGFLKNKTNFIVMSALFAYIKWTSFPFLFVIFIVYSLSSRNINECARTLRLGLIYLLIILLMSLSFGSEFIHFITGLFIQERYAPPTGISLAVILNANFVKTLPVLLILLGYLHLQRNNKSFVNLIPYIMGSGILLLTYPTVANEYNIPSLICFIPLVFYWTKHSSAMKIIKYVFFVFVFLISFPGYLSLFIDRYTVLVGYFAVSVTFLLLPLIHPGENSTKSPNITSI